MHQIRTFTVVPSLPPSLVRLRELALNLWWSWTPDAYAVFRWLDSDLWDEVGHSPVKLLSRLDQKRLEQAANDTAYLAQLERVMDRFYMYLSARSWFATSYPDLADTRIAYFSMEFGLHESLPIYSGGLGVLAGDHLKSASDLGMPLVGVGLLYRHGYFQQRLTNDGWQLEEYPAIDFYQLPITRVMRQDNAEQAVEVEVKVGDRMVRLAIWQVQVGRVPLYLMDADMPENHPADRDITARLYQGVDEDRIRQEIVLGIGGIRLLDALGIRPDVCHMNEGHSAFLSLERLRQRMHDDGLDFGAAREATVPGQVFTTHTPVPAGIDTFSDDLLKRYLGEASSAVGLSLEGLRQLGKTRPADASEPFNMAVFGLRLAGDSNGVSALHGQVSRGMWQHVWPGAPIDEVPIHSVTNGVHLRTWLSAEIAGLLERYWGPSWADDPVNHEIWDRIDEIPDLELWRTRERRRERLITFARHRLKSQLRLRGAPLTELKAADEVLDPHALTIGFARRFAPYKRAALILRDVKRLAAILTNPDRPVQIIFAGKAHPRDELGKELIKQILTVARNPEFRRRLVFIENYDMNVARYLVQGCDVWLNNPFRPREASGTSGMKVVPNGGLNLSVLDGWWPEAYDGENGWAIGDGRMYEDPGYQDYLESEAIYDLIEKEIVPLYYERSADGLPRRWISRVKSSMQSICPVFNTNRMVEEYANQHYAPAARRARHMTSNGYSAAKALSAWKFQMSLHWNEVRVDNVETNEPPELAVGAKLALHVHVHLGSIKPSDVAVEVYYGPVDSTGRIVDGATVSLEHDDDRSNGNHHYRGEIPCVRSGQQGYAVRVVARHPDLTHRYDTGMIIWS